MRICDDYQLFGDWSNETSTIPGGFDRLAGLMSDEGIVPGICTTPTMTMPCLIPVMTIVGMRLCIMEPRIY